MSRMESLPIVALRGLTIVPEMVVHFDVSREKSILAVKEAMAGGQRLMLFTQKDLDCDDPGQMDLYQVGTIATIKQMIKLPKNELRVVVSAEEVAVLNHLEFESPYLRGNATVEDEQKLMLGEIDREGMIRSLKDLFANYASRNSRITKDVMKLISDTTELEVLIRRVAANIIIDYVDRQKLLETRKYDELFDTLAEILTKEMEVNRVRDEIQRKVKTRMDEQHREYVLREELKLIREELGDGDTSSDADEFAEAVENLQASEEVKAKIRKEIARFRNTMQSPAEMGVIRNYIETMLEMPWDKRVEDYTDIQFAAKLLDAEHYGMKDVKERVLEYLAVRALTKKGDSPIMCLFGPPGTGKTSIARSLAKALKKPYVRISLGGVRDEAEIRGHRKTYVGAMPGRLANAIRTAGVKNPLILLDEIDKVSSDYKGDTFSALLEVLDSEQNMNFRDHFLEVPLDLSEVTFVTTANSLSTIPKPLLDRMEVIDVSSYTENEKLHIAERHLIPKQIARHGLKPSQLRITKEVIWKIARNYTKEAGVRQMEREISNICRKAAREIYEQNRKMIRVTAKNVEKYLGKEKFSYQMANQEDEVGLVRGLAWTAVGGDTLEIEVNSMPGKGEILLTGQLGDVMKESARIAISYIRSVGDKYGIDPEYFKEHDIHVHVPEGATPKDGPSAGITLATAILSTATGRKVHADIAMTGEVTLRGRVLPIGGLKEKLLAAGHAGMKRVLVPEENRKDVELISNEITDLLQIYYVTNMDEVAEYALCK